MFRRIKHPKLVILLIGVIIVAYGILQLVSGHPVFPNYWGGVVYAPFVIAIGAIAIWIGISPRL